MKERLWIFEDNYEREIMERIDWRKGSELGVELIIDKKVIKIDEERIENIEGKYY